MSRKSFDDGHQNAGHASGGIVDFDVMHNLFHGHREVISDVARDEGISFDEAAGFVPDAIAEVDADNLENYEVNDLGDLVDPQNDTYEEEGTHGLNLETVGRGIGTFVGKRVGLGKLGGAAGAKLGVKAEEKLKDPEFQEDVKEKVGAAAESATEIAGKALGTVGKAAKGLIGKRGAGLASPSKGDASDSDDWGSTPDSDDPFA